MLVEDDIYGDFHPGPATRLATLDQLKRVIYVSSFSKSVSASLRVGYLACSPALATSLCDVKLLTGLTTSEISERLMYQLLTEGHYRKHLERLRTRLDRARDKTVRQLEKLGIDIPMPPSAGMFVWADIGSDANALTERALAQGYLLAPGSLFSPRQLPSSLMRLNITTMNEAGIWKLIERARGG